MSQYRKDLPPLDNLLFFHAAANNPSLSSAAQELFVTQAAVSKRIQRFEDWLGTPLFSRDNNSLQITEAGKVLAYKSFRIIFKHILPNIIGPVIVISAANFASAILIESGLSFLGIGAQPPVASWGNMIKDHYSYIIMNKAYLAVIPGLAIMSLVLAFMLLGNGLREVFNVKK